MYIGTKDLDRLATFVSGYECALFDLLGIQSQFKTIEAVLGTSLLGDVGIWASTALFIAQQSTALLETNKFYYAGSSLTWSYRFVRGEMLY